MRVKIILFISSYAPLFAILAIRFEQPSLRVLTGVVAGLGLLALAILLLAGRRGEGRRFEIVEVVDKGHEVAGYIATYLLPFIVLTTPTGPDLAGYGIFLVVSAVVFVQSSMVHINPVVYLIGGRIYSIRTTADFSYFVISWKELKPGNQLWASDILSTLLVARRRSSRLGGIA